MTVVAQADLVNAVSVDELLALGENPTLSALLIYVRDGSQSTENAKHRKVALDVLRTLLQPVLKTVNSESLFGSGDLVIAGGADFTPDTTVQTGNFAFGSGGVGWHVPVDLSLGNIVGTLPLVVPHGQIVRVFGKGISSGSANRFTFNLNSNSFFNGNESFGARAASGAQSTVAPWFTTELGVSSFSSSNLNVGTNGTDGSGFRLELSPSSFFQFTVNCGTGGGTFSIHFLSGATTLADLGVSPYVNGVLTRPPVAATVNVGFGIWRRYDFAIPSGASNVFRLECGDSIVRMDDLQLTNTPTSQPADWTDVTARNIGPKGYVEIIGLNGAWHPLQRTQLGL